jgi:hypothetical protein
MASATKRTELIRKQKLAGKGKKRKAKNRNQGTTPKASKLFGDN